MCSYYIYDICTSLYICTSAQVLITMCTMYVHNIIEMQTISYIIIWINHCYKYVCYPWKHAESISFYKEIAMSCCRICWQWTIISIFPLFQIRFLTYQGNLYMYYMSIFNCVTEWQLFLWKINIISLLLLYELRVMDMAATMSQRFHKSLLCNSLPPEIASCASLPIQYHFKFY